MGHILHDWDLDEKKGFSRNAFDTLPSGGAVVVYDAVIDDDRPENAFGLMMSLNLLIETRGGFDYTGADCRVDARGRLLGDSRRASCRSGLDGDRNKMNLFPIASKADHCRRQHGTLRGGTISADAVGSADDSAGADVERAVSWLPGPRAAICYTQRRRVRRSANIGWRALSRYSPELKATREFPDWPTPGRNAS